MLCGFVKAMTANGSGLNAVWVFALASWVGKTQIEFKPMLCDEILSLLSVGCSQLNKLNYNDRG